MDIARSALLRRIFDEAAERPEAQRAEFVHQECAGDVAMEREVLSLLDALRHGSASLEADPATWLVGGSLTAPDPATPLPSSGVPPGNDPVMASDLRGTTIGDFRLGPLIGRGGIGAVYAAEQISLKRPVAVKLLQSWTASREARRRFVEESAILARLRHPSIAQVIAAGTRELDLNGPDRALAAGLFNDLHSVPWIAMELVEGARTIVQYCREESLPPMDILALFAAVSDAVHHGHQQGVIHRDLKPANILVSARGETKIIDFGVAKAIGDDPQHDGPRTQQGSVFGTLRYMSPEQCDGRGRPVDTRSDVYALGVVLYESLTGVLPYALDEASLASVAKAVCEATPIDPRSLQPSLKADTVAVLMKALGKVPAERYQSAAELAADLRRVIAREPVLARRASVLYRVRMFARRRPATTALIVAAVLGMFVGIAGLGLGIARERVARAEAERTAWIANLTAADSSLRLGDGGSAMRRLNAVPPHRRGWEWRYLEALADTSVSSWQIDSKPEGVFLSHTGRYAYCYNTQGLDRHADIIDTSSRQIILSIADGIPAGTVAWNSDESLIALPQAQGVVLLNAKTGAEVRRWPPTASGGPLGAEFSPDGSLLAVGLSELAGVVVYDVRSGETVFSRPSEAWVYHPAFSPDGKELAWSDVKTVESVDTATWASRRSVATARITSVEPGNLAYSPDGRLLAVVCGLVVQVIDVESWTVRATLRGHAQRIHWLAFDDSSNRLVTTSIDRTVRIWDSNTGELITTLLGHESPTHHARFLSGATQGQASVISVDSAARVRTWNLGANGPVFSARADDASPFINQLDFVSSTATLRAVGRNALISIDLETRPSLLSRDHFDGHFLGVIPGEELALVNTASRSLSLICLADDNVEWTRDLDPVFEFVVSPDGQLIAAFRKNGQISILRVSDGVELGQTPPDPNGSHRPAFSPDGRVLATLSRDGALRLWNASNATLITELASEADRAHGLCWSSDGTLLAYANAPQGVTVLDTQTRRPVTTIESVGGNVWSIAISPDKTRMAVGAQDRITHLYELPSGDELLQLRDHTGTVMSIAWRADGRYLATGGYDKRVFVYDSKARPSSESSSTDHPEAPPVRR